jgi:hypothetical protein
MTIGNWLQVAGIGLLTAAPFVAMIYALFTKSAKVRFWICRPLSVLMALGAVVTILDRSGGRGVVERVASFVLFSVWLWWLSGRDPNKSK